MRSGYAGGPNSTSPASGPSYADILGYDPTPPTRQEVIRLCDQAFVVDDSAGESHLVKGIFTLTPALYPSVMVEVQDAQRSPEFARDESFRRGITEAIRRAGVDIDDLHSSPGYEQESGRVILMPDPHTLIESPWFDVARSLGWRSAADLGSPWHSGVIIPLTYLGDGLEYSFGGHSFRLTAGTLAIATAIHELGLGMLDASNEQLVHSHLRRSVIPRLVTGGAGALFDAVSQLKPEELAALLVPYDVKRDAVLAPTKVNMLMKKAAVSFGRPSHYRQPSSMNETVRLLGEACALMPNLRKVVYAVGWFEAPDQFGRKHMVKGVGIGLTPELPVRVNLEKSVMLVEDNDLVALAADPVFTSALLERLRKAGYAGSQLRLSAAGGILELDLGRHSPEFAAFAQKVGIPVGYGV